MLYTLGCAAVTCCTAGVSFFAIVSLILDGVMIALMIALAAINGSARYGCKGGDPYPRTVYDGSGPTGCKLFVASWAVTIIAIFAFLAAAAAQFMIRRRSRTHVNRVSKGMWTILWDLVTSTNTNSSINQWLWRTRKQFMKIKRAGKIERVQTREIEETSRMMSWFNLDWQIVQ